MTAVIAAIAAAAVGGEEIESSETLERAQLQLNDTALFNTIDSLQQHTASTGRLKSCCTIVILLFPLFQFLLLLLLLPVFELLEGRI